MYAFSEPFVLGSDDPVAYSWEGQGTLTFRKPSNRPVPKCPPGAPTYGGPRRAPRSSPSFGLRPLTRISAC